jgi:hypothetical protein
MFNRCMIVVLGLLAFAAILGFWERNAIAQEQKAVAVTVWEYKVVKDGELLTVGRDEKDALSVEKLNKLGEESWELAATYTNVSSEGRPGGKTFSSTFLVFKRPKSK